MNPLSNVRFIKQLNEKEVKLGINEKASWHNEYKDSAWVFVGGLSYELTEGDVVCVFSQYGEIVNINLVRDKATGKSKGYCFICYEDQRSTVLAVDNLNGIKLCNRVIRVDHVANYKVPKDFADTDPLVIKLRDEGCGPDALKKDSSAIFPSSTNIAAMSLRYRKSIFKLYRLSISQRHRNNVESLYSLISLNYIDFLYRIYIESLYSSNVDFLHRRDLEKLRLNYIDFLYGLYGYAI